MLFSMCVKLMQNEQQFENMWLAGFSVSEEGRVSLVCVV